MAGAGVSSGERSKSLFGWVRNLRMGKRSIVDLMDHQYDITSLFGLFYGLIRGRIPFFSDSFEEAIEESGIPRLDPVNTAQFTLPFTDENITFSANPLAPPEGYISRNFSRGIHCEKCWEGCPWGVYWNLVRQHPQGPVGMNSGASFVNATYGIRVVNASNTCVGWDRRNLHGTGKYEGGLEHVGIAILLGDSTKSGWEKYKAQVRDGTLEGDGLLWYPGSGDEDEDEDEDEDMDEEE